MLLSVSQKCGNIIRLFSLTVSENDDKLNVNRGSNVNLHQQFPNFNLTRTT